MTKFDLDQTRALAALFTTPQEQRDEGWAARFYAAVPEATLQSFDPQVEQGPDGFPYFQMSIPAPGPVTPFCITHVLDFCLENGFGVVVHADPDRNGPPGWVFTYGQLLAYKLYGRFDGDPGESAEGATSGTIKVEEAREVLVGAPSETYFPSYARRAMGGFFRDALRHPDPKIALVVDHTLTPSRNLMVNISREHYAGDEEKLNAVFRYLFWYLPGNYALLALPAGWSTENFVPLA